MDSYKKKIASYLKDREQVFEKKKKVIEERSKIVEDIAGVSKKMDTLIKEMTDKTPETQLAVKQKKLEMLEEVWMDHYRKLKKL